MPYIGASFFRERWNWHEKLAPASGIEFMALVSAACVRGFRYLISVVPIISVSMWHSFCGNWLLPVIGLRYIVYVRDKGFLLTSHIYAILDYMGPVHGLYIHTFNICRRWQRATAHTQLRWQTRYNTVVPVRKSIKRRCTLLVSVPLAKANAILCSPLVLEAAVTCSIASVAVFSTMQKTSQLKLKLIFRYLHFIFFQIVFVHRVVHYDFCYGISQLVTNIILVFVYLPT